MQTRAPPRPAGWEPAFEPDAQGVPGYLEAELWARSSPEEFLGSLLVSRDARLPAFPGHRGPLENVAEHTAHSHSPQALEMHRFAGGSLRSFAGNESVGRSVLSDSLGPPWTVARQPPLSVELSRILEWVTIPFSRGSSRVRN